MTMQGINWLAVGAGLVVAQIYLTVWFAALFAKPWAKAYGVDDPKEHTKAVPGYTYGIGAACALVLNMGIAVLQASLGTQGVGEAVMLGVFLALHFGVATALPGYAFLKRWGAGVLAIGSQATLIVVLSVLHAVL